MAQNIPSDLLELFDKFDEAAMVRCYYYNEGDATQATDAFKTYDACKEQLMIYLSNYRNTIIDQIAEVILQDRRSKMAIEFNYEPEFHKMARHIAVEVLKMKDQ